jgi:hypothetical protein
VFGGPSHTGLDFSNEGERQRAIARDCREICNVAANIKNIVNQNEGWTIVGWYQKGEIVDASAKPNDAGSEITSDNHPIHISYLYPTKPSCLDDVRRYPRGENATTGGEDATTGTAN